MIQCRMPLYVNIFVCLILCVIFCQSLHVGVFPATEDAVATMADICVGSIYKTGSLCLGLKT